MLVGLGTSLPPVDATGAAKLLVTTRALRVRRDNPHLFCDYAPLDPHGAAAAHAIAVDRGGVVAVATRLPMTLQRTGGWRGTVLDVGRGPLIDVITGRHVEGGMITIAELLDRYPVALLAPVDVVDSIDVAG
jgi:(1->4)-alpha-D-glucan 1-alpha-D-glucosylmutase